MDGIFCLLIPKNLTIIILSSIKDTDGIENCSLNTFILNAFQINFFLFGPDKLFRKCTSLHKCSSSFAFRLFIFNSFRSDVNSNLLLKKGRELLTNFRLLLTLISGHFGPLLKRQYIP